MASKGGSSKAAGKSGTGKSKKFEDMDALDKFLELNGTEWSVDGPTEINDVQIDFDAPVDYSSNASFGNSTQVTYELSLCLKGSANTLNLRASRLKGSGASVDAAREALIKALKKQWIVPEHKHQKGESSKKEGESSKKKGKK